MIKLKKKLGDLLIENKVINYGQLQKALNEQKKSGERLGRVLVNLGYLTEEDISNVLEMQLGISQAKLDSTELSPEVIGLIPEALIRRHRVIPIKKEGNKLTIAMVDPLNIVALDDLQIATGTIIEPAVATEKEIDAVIQKYFGVQKFMGKVAEDIEDVEVMPSADLPIFNMDSISGAMANEAPIIRVVNSIIHQAVKERASDIHIEPRENEVRIRFRIDGLLREIMNLPRHIIAAVVSRIKIMGDMDIAEKRIPLDGRIQVKIAQKSIDLRVSTLPTIFGEKVVIRVLDKDNVLLRLDELGMPPELLKSYRGISKSSYGMILITGPTGSGKTTTLYSTLSEINTPDKNIITIEDPVEYVLDDINQIRVNQKAGLDFATGLRAILRQDPDVVMVGEIRDGETADIAVRAATTGHLVLSTLHTNDAASTLLRLIDIGVEPFLVASSVIAVMAQRLIRVICPTCKEPYEVPPSAPARSFLNLSDTEPVLLYKGKGCANCGYTGYRGRKIIQELLPITSVQRNLIKEKATADEIWRSAVDQGMVTLKQDGIQKALKGLTTIDEIMRVAMTEDL